KSEVLKDCHRWAIGSDYPFCKKDYLFLDEEKKFIRDMGEDVVIKMHENVKWFFESDYKELTKKNIELNNFNDFNARPSKRVAQPA
ncbi:hypothetical protein EBU95_19440, partial [bacterium]|nr:hypothetical protein [bacterium]